MTDADSRAVVQGDVFDRLSHLDTDSAHCGIVDYPWEFDAANGTNRFGEHAESTTIEDLPYDLQSSDRLVALFDELARVLVDGAWVLVMADDDFQDDVREALRASQLERRRNWAWTPEHMGMGKYGRVNHYPIPTATNGDTERYVDGRGTLYTIPGGRNTEYPTGKPVDLYRELLEPPAIAHDERLLEPFCGAGPGAAVAAERGLDYWGCDLAPGAVKAARERLTRSSLAAWGDDG